MTTDFLSVGHRFTRIENVKTDNKGFYIEVIEDKEDFSIFNPKYTKVYLNEVEAKEYEEKQLSNIAFQKRQDAITLARKEGRFTATPQITKSENKPGEILFYQYFYENGKEIK